MVLTRKQLEADSWKFATTIYAEPGIAETCLALQRDGDVDVLILLMTAYAAARHGSLFDDRDLLDIDELCAPWRAQIVRPLRALRIALKTGPAPAPGKSTEQLRSAIKRNELAAERLQNDLLAGYLLKKNPARAAGARREVCQAVERAIRFFATRDGKSAMAALETVADAITDAACRCAEAME